MGWIILGVVGLIAGALAKWIMPGKDPGGIIVTMLIGVAGAYVGGWIASLLGIAVGGGFSISAILAATGGALVLLFIYRLITK